MKTHTHTSGPWYPVTINASYSWVIESELTDIARLPEWPDNKAEAEANARLIASAPDLLDALEKIIVGLSPASVEVQREWLPELCQVCREIAKNALAKVERGAA